MPAKIVTAPFAVFEDVYHAYFAMTQEAEAKLSPDSARAVVNFSTVALLMSFDGFCYAQIQSVFKLRRDFKVTSRKPRSPEVPDLINASFKNAVGRDLFSFRDRSRYRAIARQCTHIESALRLTSSTVRERRSRRMISWSQLSSTLFDFAVEITRSTGLAVKKNLNPKLEKHRKIIRSADRLLRARFDSL